MENAFFMRCEDIANEAVVNIDQLYDFNIKKLSLENAS